MKVELMPMKALPPTFQPAKLVVTIESAEEVAVLKYIYDDVCISDIADGEIRNDAAKLLVDLAERLYWEVNSDSQDTQ
jgi:hypothetical protein